MFGSYLVELVIGLSFLFAVLGIVTSAVTEAVLSVLRTRSKHLQEWLLQWTAQLSKNANAATAAAPFSLQALYAHPLIASHRRGADCSYLPADHLSAAFLQILAMPFSTTCVGQTLQHAEQGLRNHINTLQSDELKNALHALLNNAAAVKNKVACLSKNAEDAVGALGHLSRLGIGWDRPPKFLTASNTAVQASEFLVWLVGLLCAAFAASLGGDFWIKWIGDIVRLTGYKPRAATEEAKK